MKKLPIILIYSRIIMAIIIIVITLLNIEEKRIWIVSLMTLALLTDIFDGIIARKLNISTDKLRILDSNVDQFFWLTTIGCIFYINSSFVLNNVVWISLILMLEILTYVLSYIKFKKTIATHTILAKFWTLTLFAFLVDLTLNADSKFLFKLCIIVGILSRLEIISIIIKLKKWSTDIPSIFSVSKLNRGEPIKKHKLFNS